MQDWIEELDRQLFGNKRELLKNKGRVSHKQAVEKAEKEFEIYRQREMKELELELELDFDKAIKKITQNNN